MNFGAVKDEAGLITAVMLRRLATKLDELERRIALTIRNTQIIASHADLQDLDFADAGHTGFASQASLNAHTTATNNPHSVTLEQAIAAGATATSQPTFNGGLVAGGNVLSNLGATVTAFLLNATTSRTTGDLLDVQDNGTSQLRIDSSGNVLLPASTTDQVSGFYMGTTPSSGRYNTFFPTFTAPMTTPGNGHNGVLSQFNLNALTGGTTTATVRAVNATAVKATGSDTGTQINTLIGALMLGRDRVGSGRTSSIVTLAGGQFEASCDGFGTSTISIAYGGRFRAVYQTSAHSIINSYIANIDPPNLNTFTGTITDHAGMRIQDQSEAGTNNWAIRINNPTINPGADRNNLAFDGGNFNSGHIELNTGHLWMDVTNGVIRFNSATPTSETDGTDLTAGGAGATTEMFLDFGTREVAFA